MPDAVRGSVRESALASGSSRARGRALALAVSIILLDQLTKALVRDSLAVGEGIVVAPFLNLVLVFNRGAAFSFLASAPGWQVPFLAGLAVVAIVVIGVLLFRAPPRALYVLGLASILGGAAGNLIDRLRFGAVVDFIDLHAAGWHWPAFNVADSALTIGAGMLILDSFLPARSGAAR